MLRRTRAAAAEAVLQQVVVLREERLGVAGVAPLGNLRDKFVHHELFNTAAISKAKTNSRHHSHGDSNRPYNHPLPSDLASSAPDLDMAAGF